MVCIFYGTVGVFWYKVKALHITTLHGNIGKRQPYLVISRFKCRAHQGLISEAPNGPLCIHGGSCKERRIQSRRMHVAYSRPSYTCTGTCRTAMTIPLPPRAGRANRPTLLAIRASPTSLTTAHCSSASMTITRSPT